MVELKVAMMAEVTVAQMVLMKAGMKDPTMVGRKVAGLVERWVLN